MQSKEILKLKQKLMYRDRSIERLKKKLEESEFKEKCSLNRAKCLEDKLTKFQNDVEEILKTCSRIEWLKSQEVNPMSETHKYAMRVCEDLLFEIQKTKGEKQ